MLLWLDDRAAGMEEDDPVPVQLHPHNILEAIERHEVKKLRHTCVRRRLRGMEANVDGAEGLNVNAGHLAMKESRRVYGWF